MTNRHRPTERAIFHVARTLLPLVSLILLAAHVDDRAFRLQLLHFADVDGSDFDALDNIRTFSALVAAFRDQFPNRTLLLSSGDNFLPGLRHDAAADPAMRPVLGVPGAGRADVALLNALGVHASAVGNHELDGGPSGFVRAIRAEHDPASGSSFPGARFPFLSANIDFRTDDATAGLRAADGQDAASIPGRLAASAFVDLRGGRIGLVGAATPDFENITDTGDLSLAPGGLDIHSPASLDALAAELQRTVDALTATGIDKVILLAHMQQLAVERALASRLRDVDIIVGGGSNALLADDDDRLRPDDVADDHYPLLHRSPDGDPVLLVNTAGDYGYVGRLVVAFDQRGILQLDSLDATRNGAYATDRPGLLANLRPIPEVAAVADALDGVLRRDPRARATSGSTAVNLEGQRGNVRTRETNLGNLIADANLAHAQSIDRTTQVSVFPGGSIRGSIPAGDITQQQLENTLPFNSALVIVTVTAAELAGIIEHAVAGSDPEATPGAFPQVGGMRFSFDPSRPGMPWPSTDSCAHYASLGTLSRVRHLVVTGAREAAGTDDTLVRRGVLQGRPGRTFRLVTSAYLADGGDSYPFPCLSRPQRVDLRNVPSTAGRATFAPPGTVQDALAEYLLENFVVRSFDVDDATAHGDQRIRNLAIDPRP